jgi:hypothetical protein
MMETTVVGGGAMDIDEDLGIEDENNGEQPHEGQTTAQHGRKKLTDVDVMKARKQDSYHSHLRRIALDNEEHSDGRDHMIFGMQYTTLRPSGGGKSTQSRRVKLNGNYRRDASIQSFMLLFLG